MTYQDRDGPHDARHQARGPGGQPLHPDDGETVVSTVEARQGGRQKMSIHVLVASMVLVLLVFFTMWFFLMHRP